MIRYALIALAALAAVGCSVSFDPEGQPCDAHGGCLPGYVCDATKHCVGNGNVNTSSGTSGGTTGSIPRCGGEVCAAGQKCSKDGGTSQCVDRTGAGVLCLGPSDCPGGTCLQQPAARVGICARFCTPGVDAGCPTGASCTSVTGARGNAFHLCLDSPPPVHCGRDADCGADAGLGCEPFNEASAVDPNLDAQLPVLFCDRASPDAGAAGSACTSDASCASGICASQGVGGICVTACAGSGCPAGQSCTAVRDFDHGEILLGCVAASTACQSCALNPAICGADAPDCDNLRGICVLGCSSSDANACGGSRGCLSNQGGSPFCAVDGGRCP